MRSVPSPAIVWSVPRQSTVASAAATAASASPHDESFPEMETPAKETVCPPAFAAVSDALSDGTQS